MIHAFFRSFCLDFESPSPVKHEILRLEIPMDDLVLSRSRIQCVGGLRDIFRCFL
jgi:hypothetical protein